MALRVLLVGLVAGLGLTLPTGGRTESLGTVFRGWVNARLAEWDARENFDARDFVLIDEPLPVLRATPSAPPESLANVVSHEPIAAVIDAHPAAIAGLGEALDVPTAPANPDDHEIELTDSRKSEELNAAMFVAQADFLDGLRADASARAALDTDFNAAQALVVAAFCADQESAKPLLETKVPDPRFEPIDAPDDLYAGIAYSLNKGAEGVESPVVSVVPARALEPIDVLEDLYTGTAYALNRQSEGLDVATPCPAPTQLVGERTVSVGGDGRLSQAVRLTREAVYAWASLLHGPAVVTLAH